MKVTQEDIGKKVLLAAFEKEPEEVGEVMEVNDQFGTVIVEVERSGHPCDDGIRECEMDQIIKFVD